MSRSVQAEGPHGNGSCNRQLTPCLNARELLFPSGTNKYIYCRLLDDTCISKCIRESISLGPRKLTAEEARRRERLTHVMAPETSSCGSFSESTEGVPEPHSGEDSRKDQEDLYLGHAECSRRAASALQRDICDKLTILLASPFVALCYHDLSVEE
jgi:hypothetical protein